MLALAAELAGALVCRHARAVLSCRAGLVAGAGFNVANFLPSLLAETQGDFKRSFTNTDR